MITTADRKPSDNNSLSQFGPRLAAITNPLATRGSLPLRLAPPLPPPHLACSAILADATTVRPGPRQAKPIPMPSWCAQSHGPPSPLAPRSNGPGSLDPPRTCRRRVTVPPTPLLIETCYNDHQMTPLAAHSSLLSSFLALALIRRFFVGHGGAAAAAADFAVTSALPSSDGAAADGERCPTLLRRSPLGPSRRLLLRRRCRGDGLFDQIEINRGLHSLPYLT
ncbi:hypothetical protein NL676_035309 [Syzygium grande]|nr:hypothetical protein NL676_035309 [Syzygium grande]